MNKKKTLVYAAAGTGVLLLLGIGYLTISGEDFGTGFAGKRLGTAYEISAGNDEDISIQENSFETETNFLGQKGVYRNEKWHFSLKIPESWEGKYQVNEEENTIRFLQTATYEKYGTGSGCLFYITCIEGIKTQEEVDAMADGAFPRPIIMQAGEITYVYGLPTDVQYPIWEDADMQDKEIAGEYEKMASDIAGIIESIAQVED